MGETPEAVYSSQTPLPPTPAMMPRAVSEPEAGPGYNYQDPDRFLQKAKQLVVEHYNAHHREKLRMDDVYIASFTKILRSWKAVVTVPRSVMIAMPSLKGMSWTVTFNGQSGEAYIEIFRKTDNVTVRRDRV